LATGATAVNVSVIVRVLVDSQTVGEPSAGECVRSFQVRTPDPVVVGAGTELTNERNAGLKVSVTSTFWRLRAPAFVTTMLYVTLPPGITVDALVRILVMLMSQMSDAISVKIVLISLGLPGKYPPGEAMDAFKIASSAARRS
jgi:hypothetical protein